MITDDVDIIVEIINYHGRTALEERLRSLGFAHDIESGIFAGTGSRGSL